MVYIITSVFEIAKGFCFCSYHLANLSEALKDTGLEVPMPQGGCRWGSVGPLRGVDRLPGGLINIRCWNLAAVPHARSELWVVVRTFRVFLDRDAATGFVNGTGCFTN
jgi:hypothetical protein